MINSKPNNNNNRDTETDSVTKMLLEKYYNYEELKELLETLQQTYPKISKVFSIGKSVEDRDLLVFQISDNIDSVEPGEPWFKYVGNMHGDETVGRAMLISLIHHLLHNYGIDDRISRLVNNTNIFIMPTANPDGFEKGKEGSCEDFTEKSRHNANHKDLNRNFPDQYDDKTLNKESLFNNREPETQALMKWIIENNFVLSANLHGGSVVASYPFDDSASHKQYTYSAAPDDNLFKHLAKTYSLNHPIMKFGNSCNDNFPDGITNGAKWYDVPGGMQDFNYLHSNCLEITLELSCCKYPSASTLKQEWENNRESLLNYMEQVHIGVKGFVTDKKSKNGLKNAIITVDGNEHNVKTSLYGDYWRLLLPGTYIISASAVGYEKETKTVQIIDSNPVEINFELKSIELTTTLPVVPQTSTNENELIKLVDDVNQLTDTSKRVKIFENVIEPKSLYYHSNQQITELFKNISVRCSNIASSYIIGQSTNKNNLNAIVISDNPLVHEIGEPEVKLIANMHGDETVGRELMIKFVEYICDNYKNNDFIRRLVDNTRIHILPTLNPDGFDQVPKRENAHNIDLNRNFPSRFDDNTVKEKEPETNAIIDWSKKYPFVLSANFHGGSVVVNYPYDDNVERTEKYTPSSDDATFIMISKAYSLAHKVMYKGSMCPGDRKKFKDGITNGADWYVISGSMQDWNYYKTNDFEVTIEVSCIKNPPESDLINYWKDNKFSIFSFIGQVHKGVRGIVVDAAYNTPIQGALIQVDGIDHNITTYITGDYWRLLAPGKYWISASHPDYLSDKFEVDVDIGAARVLNFNLVPKRYKHKVVENIIQFLSKNTYGLLIAGFTILTISLIIITIACCHKIRGSRKIIKKSSNQNSVGFHRYKPIQDSEEEDDDKLTIKINSNGMNNNNNKKSTIGSKIIAATKYIKGENNTEKINFKLLNQLSDQEDDGEDENFSR